MGQPEVDVEMWPIAVIHFTSPDISDEELQAFFKDYEQKVYSRNERYLSVTNLTIGSPPGAAERRKMADWMEEYDHYMKRYAVANITVMKSALIRGALTALFWLQRPPIKQLTAGSIREAMDIGVEELRADGLSIHLPGLQEWVERRSA